MQEQLHLPYMQSLKINIFNQKIYKVSFLKQYCVIVGYIIAALCVWDWELSNTNYSRLQIHTYRSRVYVKAGGHVM